MGRQKQPVALIVAKGQKHLTKQEIETREKTEVKPINEDVTAPDYLTQRQKAAFDEIAGQLKALHIVNETDADAIARYILSREAYVKVTKQLNQTKVISNPSLLNTYLKNQDKLFKQCRAAASDLGLSITSRAKLVVPTVEQPVQPTNKFAKFTKGAV